MLLRLETSRFCKGPNRPRHSFIGNFDKTVYLMAATLIRYDSEWVRMEDLQSRQDSFQCLILFVSLPPFAQTFCETLQGLNPGLRLDQNIEENCDERMSVQTLKAD